MFKDKYTLDKTKEGEDKKVLVSNDAFLNAEMIESLVNKIERVRIKLYG